MDCGRGEKYKSRESSTITATKKCGYHLSVSTLSKTVEDDLRRLFTAI
jgi:hypothetical protein